MTMPLGPRIMAPVDCSYLLDDAGTILSVSQDRSAPDIGASFSPTSRGLGRCYLDFCTGPASVVVRSELENLLGGRTRCFATIYDCSTSFEPTVPVALIGTKIDHARQPLFNLRHVAINYSATHACLDELEHLRVSALLKEYFADPSPDRWIRIKDQPALRKLNHLFACLENIRTSMDEAVYCHDNRVTYQLISQLLVQTAAVLDAIFRRFSVPSARKN